MTRKTQKKLRKLLTLVCCAVMLVCVTVGATVAYLTSQDSVTNTFTVGKVEITLDEQKVNLYGETDGTARVAANEYKLIPGHTYIKDPTVTVVAGSEQAYVRMLVEVKDHEDLLTAVGSDYAFKYGNDTFVDLYKLVTGWEDDTWVFTSVSKSDTTATYEFRYNGIVDARNGVQKLDALFDTITLPSNVTTTSLPTLEEVEVNVTAQAIQADGFVASEGVTAEQAAWNAFGA